MADNNQYRSNDAPTIPIKYYPEVKKGNNLNLKHNTFPTNKNQNNNDSDTHKFVPYGTVAIANDLLPNVTNSTKDSIFSNASSLSQNIYTAIWKFSEKSDIQLHYDLTSLNPLISEIEDHNYNSFNFEKDRYSSNYEINIPNLSEKDISLQNFVIETLFKSIIWTFQAQKKKITGIPGVAPFLNFVKNILKDSIQTSNLLNSNYEDLTALYNYLNQGGKHILNYHKAKLLNENRQKEENEVIFEIIDHLEKSYKIPFKLHLYKHPEYTKYKKGNFELPYSVNLIWTKNKVFVLFENQAGDNRKKNLVNKVPEEIKVPKMKEPVNDSKEISMKSMGQIKSQINFLLKARDVGDDQYNKATTQIMDSEGSAASKINYLLQQLVLYRPSTIPSQSLPKKHYEEKKVDKVSDNDDSEEDKSIPIVPKNKDKEKKSGKICMFCEDDNSNESLTFNINCVSNGIGCNAAFHRSCLDKFALRSLKKNGSVQNLRCLICGSRFSEDLFEKLKKEIPVKAKSNNIPIIDNFESENHPGDNVLNDQKCQINHQHVREQDIIIYGSKCEHYYFKECLRKYVEHGIRSSEIKDLNTIKCPLCQEFIVPEIIYLHFPDLENLFYKSFGLGALT